MSEKIEKHLARTFAAESKASARNEAFALMAERDGYANLARLFRAVSNAESVHARRFLLLMRGKIGTTRDNLEDAYQFEIKATRDLYPGMVENARSEDAPSAVKKAFAQSMRTDGEHADLYRDAMNDMLDEREIDYYVCQICGHIHPGEVPENCPICKAVRGRFKRII
ncbi:MAG: rubrerythrin family protein [Deltaproteobacteria bacterium]|nr:rubrerythrin family protein [Deltaproteobacteria bacterium]